MRPASYDPDCAFCRIASGEDEAQVVAEGQTWIAFFPLNPATPGHTLVIPKAHMRDYWEAEALEQISDLAVACRDVGLAIESAAKPDGMNLITSAGSAAEQTVFHLHLHVVPRWADDEFGEIWPRPGKYERDDLGGLLDRIKLELERRTTS
jgi:histidine triad (HIT) family protein